MARHQVGASALIEVSAAKVYGIIADYQNGHPHILPKPYFVSLTVEQGGIGAGTVISFQMKLMGELQTFNATITEPEPGRLLKETTDKGAVTTFLVEPREDGQWAFVTISTETDIPDGLMGKFQGWLTTRLLRPIYLAELEQLAAFAAK